MRRRGAALPVISALLRDLRAFGLPFQRMAHGEELRCGRMSACAEVAPSAR